MARTPVERYAWLVDTIRRYGRITRSGLDECWLRSSLSDGVPLPRRTFANYRREAELMFGVEIKCDPSTFEYYLDGDGAAEGAVSEWLLNSTVTNSALASGGDIADKVFVEDVPSARGHFGLVLDALRQSQPLCFTYQSYRRSRPDKGLVLEPYFLKLFRQRWYITGRKRTDKSIRTYALDRMADVHLLPENFVPDASFDARRYAEGSFGIIFSGGEPYNIVLRTDPLQAKYLRAVPLHHSQTEYVHDDHSLFHYRMRLTPDLVSEILSYGPRITVVSPPELRQMVKSQLEEALGNYFMNTK